MMITLEELKRDKEALEEKFRKYEEQKKKKDSYELEYPEADGHRYYNVNGDGSITQEEFLISYDKNALGVGNYFLNVEEAELEVKRRKLMTRFNQFRDKCNGDWKPDFGVGIPKNFITLFDEIDELYLRVDFVQYRNIHPKFGYFKNVKDCQRAIELFGDEIKELF